MEPNPYAAPPTIVNESVRHADRRLWTVAVTLIAVVILFVLLPLMLTLLSLLACNGVAFVVLLIARRTKAASLAFFTGVLMLASS